MRDVLEDDERKVRPLGLLMLTTSAVLSVLIVYNTIYGQNHISANIITASTHVEVPAPVDGTNTVVFKYDATVEDVQRELLATGHFKGLVDGVNGQKTKVAIQQFQQEAGLPVTGEITPELINHIRYTRKVKAASEYTGSINPAPEVPVASPQPISQPVIAEQEPAPAVEEPVLPKPKKATKNTAATALTKPVAQKPAQNNNVITVQKALAAKGYAVGAANGKMSPATRAAILKFELDNGLPMDGVIDLPLLAALNN